MQVAMEGRLPAQQQPEQQQEEHLPPVEEMVRQPIHSQRHNQRPEVCALVSRSIKLEFPRFSGGDPSTWIFRAVQFFSYYNIPEEERILNAFYHLDNEALIRFQDCERSLDSWETFVRAILTEFGLSPYDDPMEALTKLKQSTTVAAYKSQFEMLSNKIRNLPESYKLSCFMSVLKDEVRLAVKMQNPRSLNAAFGLAKIQEEYLQSCRKAYKPAYEFNKNNWQSSSSAVVKTDNKGDIRSRMPIHKVSAAQMEERRKKGLCYYYDTKWHRGHQCKELKLFLMEGMDVAGEEEVLAMEEQPNFEPKQSEITLYALLGSPSPGTMRVLGQIRGHWVVILLDTGSSHNFLDFTFVQTLSLPLDTIRILEVRVANSALIKTKGECRDVSISIQGN